jgi:hypothetical protein
MDNMILSPTGEFNKYMEEKKKEYNKNVEPFCWTFCKGSPPPPIPNKYMEEKKKEYSKNIEPFCWAFCKGSPPPPPPPPPIPNTNTTINNTTIQKDFQTFLDERRTLNENNSKDIQNIKKNINTSILVSSMDNMLKSAVTNVIASNSSSITSYLEASNVFDVSNVNTDGEFNFSVDQSNKVDSKVTVNVTQQLKTDIDNSFTTEISNTVDIAKDILNNKKTEGQVDIGDVIAKVALAANMNAINATDASGKILADQIKAAKELSSQTSADLAAASQNAIASAASLAKGIIGGAPGNTNTTLNTINQKESSLSKTTILDDKNINNSIKNIQDELALDESVKSDQKADVKSTVQNILSPSNILKTANDVKASNAIKLQNINAKGSVNIKSTQANIMNALTEALVNQVIDSNISNKTIDKLTRTFSKIDKIVSEDSKEQGNVDAIGLALAGVIKSGGDAANKNLILAQEAAKLSTESSAAIAKNAGDSLNTLVKTSTASSKDLAVIGAEQNLAKAKIDAAVKIKQAQLAFDAGQSQTNLTTFLIVLLIFALVIFGVLAAYWYIQSTKPCICPKSSDVSSSNTDTHT